jgi:hypothetical protein
MMGNLAIFLVLLAAVAVFGWLATRTLSRRLSVAMVGLLSIGLVLGFVNGVADLIQLDAPASNPTANGQVAGTFESIGRNEEFARFCEGCHSSDRPMSVASDSVSISSGTPLVFVPPEISLSGGKVDAQEVVAYSQAPGPDLKVVASNWTEADFIETIRVGKDPEGHILAHRMPWRDISAFTTDDDLRAYYVSLRGLTQTETSAR